MWMKFKEKIVRKMRKRKATNHITLKSKNMKKLKKKRKKNNVIDIKHLKVIRPYIGDRTTNASTYHSNVPKKREKCQSEVKINRTNGNIVVNSQIKNSMSNMSSLLFTTQIV